MDAKVIINSRTGSVVMNRDVILDSCAVAGQPVGGGRSAEHRQPTDDAVRWRPDGGDAKHPDPVQQQGGSLQKVNASANLNNVIRALNALGATPIDLMSILQAMQSAGCLRAKLEII